MPRRCVWFVALGMTGAVTVQAGCGPSVQTIYEGNIRFEHCYRLDLDVTKAPSHRHACWQNWLRVYTYSQPRDRIEYARKRLHSIETGDLDRPTLHLAPEHNPNARQWYLSTPAPVDPHAPPPAIVQNSSVTPSSAASSAESRENADQPPEATCNAACRAGWQGCLDKCKLEGSRPNACAPCEADYLTCMRRCFR